MWDKVEDFVHESNRIEGIHRLPTADEIKESVRFLNIRTIDTFDVSAIQQVYAPDHKLRDVPGLNVRVGNYIAPAGGPFIREQLIDIVASANTQTESPWRVHVRFEMLHPYTDGNGRTGRILWAWQMLKSGRNPFAMPFLHRFYYQTLEAQG